MSGWVGGQIVCVLLVWKRWTCDAENTPFMPYIAVSHVSLWRNPRGYICRECINKWQLNLLCYYYHHHHQEKSYPSSLLKYEPPIIAYQNTNHQLPLVCWNNKFHITNLWWKKAYNLVGRPRSKLHNCTIVNWVSMQASSWVYIK